MMLTPVSSDLHPLAVRSTSGAFTAFDGAKMPETRGKDLAAVMSPAWISLDVPPRERFSHECPVDSIRYCDAVPDDDYCAIDGLPGLTVAAPSPPPGA